MLDSYAVTCMQHSDMFQAVHIVCLLHLHQIWFFILCSAAVDNESCKFTTSYTMKVESVAITVIVYTMKVESVAITVIVIGTLVTF